jgi:hypothetical protein
MLLTEHLRCAIIPVLTQMSGITAHAGTLTIEEWKAEQQLGGRVDEHSSSCQ